MNRFGSFKKQYANYYDSSDGGFDWDNYEPDTETHIDANGNTVDSKTGEILNYAQQGVNILTQLIGMFKKQPQTQQQYYPQQNPSSQYLVLGVVAVLVVLVVMVIKK